MSAWLNGWTITYAAACAAMVIAIRSTRAPSEPLRWARLAGWLGGAALTTLVVWSVLACLALHVPAGTAMDWRILPVCFLGSAFWASIIIGAFLPLYALLLVWYARRQAWQEASLRSVARWSLTLSLPAAVWVAYANAFPTYGDPGRSLRLGLTAGVLALVSCWVGLLAPRTVRALGVGRLSGRAAA